MEDRYQLTGCTQTPGHLRDGISPNATGVCAQPDLVVGYGNQEPVRGPGITFKLKGTKTGSRSTDLHAPVFNVHDVAHSPSQ